MVNEGGERGIIFDDPIRENHADQIAPLFVSLIRAY
jgi:hypothetical protein